MDYSKLQLFKAEALHHLQQELLPFWLDRCKDEINGGYITHFDQYGKDTGLDEKSMLGQARLVYTFASAYRSGLAGEEFLDLAKHGVDFLLDQMWDKEYEGFYWTTDRKGVPQIPDKILYGHSFIIYSLSEYTLASGDPRGLKYAERSFDLLQKYAADTMYGGYFEMFHHDWTLRGPGRAGGDRKTLDVHMHLMEAFTTLYECSGKEVHRRKLKEVIELLTKRILHPEHLTGIPQFWANWQVAPQIEFEIIWGLDRFDEAGVKKNADDNTSYGHNVEFAWLLMHALDILEQPYDELMPIIKKQYEHALKDGIDWEFGGVYVEGSHAGGVHDQEKEFWQQAEMMIGLLQACLVFGPGAYFPAYENIHRFVFDKLIDHNIGEWRPLLTREGQPIWTHLSTSWKLNYHSVRAVVQSILRMEQLLKI